MSTRAGLVFGLCLACSNGPAERVQGSLELVLLHTSDLHSQLFPRSLSVGARDAERGLGIAGERAEIGGAARIAALFRRERQRKPRVLAFDSGDAMQGAAVFNEFGGEAELVALSLLELDAQVLGNHELDLEPEALVRAYREFARFPALSANLVADDGASALAFAEPWTIVAARGLRVGVIGVSNPSSPAVLRQRSNPFGVSVRQAAEVVQAATDELRPLVDLIVVLSHIGIDADVVLIHETSGIDVVLGGHQHFVLDEPLRIWDCAGGAVDVAGSVRNCSPRPVVLAHSGAFGKFVGRLALELSDGGGALDGFEVGRAEFELLPVTQAAGEDLSVARSLEPYRVALEAALTSGYAPEALARYGITRGDSPLGNLVAEAFRRRADADLALVNTTGIRADLPRGPITAERWFEILPFDDELSIVTVLGSDLAELFESLAIRAIERETSPIQLAGLRLRFDGACPAGACATAWIAEPARACQSAADCRSPQALCSTELGRSGRQCFEPLEAERIYVLATTEYLARGATGYEALSRGALHETGHLAREVVEEFARGALRCSESPSGFAACRTELAAELCAVLPCVASGRDGRIEMHLD